MPLVGGVHVHDPVIHRPALGIPHHLVQGDAFPHGPEEVPEAALTGFQSPLGLETLGHILGHPRQPGHTALGIPHHVPNDPQVAKRTIPGAADLHNAVHLLILPLGGGEGLPQDRLIPGLQTLDPGLQVGGCIQGLEPVELGHEAIPGQVAGARDPGPDAQAGGAGGHLKALGEQTGSLRLAGRGFRLLGTPGSPWPGLLPAETHGASSACSPFGSRNPDLDSWPRGSRSGLA